MTSTIDRDDVGTAERDAPERDDRAAGAPRQSRSAWRAPDEGTAGRAVLYGLAALSLGAGGIHFAVSGGHFDLSWKHGAFFAVAAWLQLAWAAAVVMRPSRRLLLAGVAGNAAILGLWAMSRVWGVPVGPDAWTPEEASLADILSSGFEGAIVLGSLALLSVPLWATRSIRPLLAVGSIGIVGLGVAGGSTLALTPSFANAHHGGGGQTAGGSDHAAGESGAHAAGANADGDAAGHTGTVIAADGTSACEQAGVANEGNSGHGHRGPVPVTPMDDATRASMALEVQAARDVITAMPTVAAAEAAGYRKITPYVPCIAAHYIKGSAFTNPFNPSEPEILLFDGTDPDSEIVGLSYLQFAGKEKAPEGFVSADDPWHVHQQLCIGGGGVLGDESTTKADCEARGGSIVPLENLWMTHMWPVPGWESRWGLFSSEHPDLGGVVGDMNGTPEGDGESLNEGLDRDKEN